MSMSPQFPLLKHLASCQVPIRGSVNNYRIGTMFETCILELDCLCSNSLILNCVMLGPLTSLGCHSLICKTADISNLWVYSFNEMLIYVCVSKNCLARKFSGTSYYSLCFRHLATERPMCPWDRVIRSQKKSLASRIGKLKKKTEQNGKEFTAKYKRSPP